MFRSNAVSALFLPLAAALAFACGPSATPASFHSSGSTPSAYLGLSAAFSVLAGTTVTSLGPTTLTGNLGVNPGTAVTGFPPGMLLPPAAMHLADAVSLQAQGDVTTAYNTLAGLPCTADKTGSDLGGMTLVPGVYCFTSTAQLTGTLTLDGTNAANAAFVFQIGSGLTVASGSAIRLINGADPCHVSWQVGSSAVIGTTAAFVGDVLALTSIGLQNGASLDGRALARNGAVTLDSNQIRSDQCAVAPAGDAGSGDTGSSDAGGGGACELREIGNGQYSMTGCRQEP